MGAAGIFAARLLERAGADVSCFEAGNRVGGRLLSTPLPNGAWLELGGEWIDADHHRVLALAQELGVGIDASPRLAGRVYYRGDWAPEDQLWRAVLGDEWRFDSRAEELARDLPAAAESLKGKTLRSLVDETAQTDPGRFWLAAKLRSDEGDDPDRIGLLGWLDFYRKYLDRDEPSMSAFRISGGAGTMMEQSSKSLPIEFGMELRGVDDRGEYAVLQFGDEVREVDKVVIALPKSVLDRIVFTPPIPQSQIEAMKGIAMGRAMKALLFFESPWWQETDWTGCLHSDGFLQQVWAAPNGAAVLCVYICGESAELLKDLPNPVQVLYDELVKLIPDSSTGFRGGELRDWISEPFSSGGFPHSTPLDPGGAWQTASRPHGRVHFAGDWAASWMGFVEGALESAERVVQEILNA